ncbi:MAG: hypothetical protein AB2704_08055, partial [Candidatus Thiodiazotropha taylori]
EGDGLLRLGQDLIGVAHGETSSDTMCVIWYSAVWQFCVSTANGRESPPINANGLKNEVISFASFRGEWRSFAVKFFNFQSAPQ